MTDLHQLQFYATPEHPCSYLPGRQAKTLFVDPKADLNQEDYSTLSDLGFRRSGPHIYRPHCHGCKACISARLAVDRFRPSKTQKRIQRINHDLSVEVVNPTDSEEVYQLYQRYISERHRDGDMYPPSPEQFHSFLVESDQQTRFMLFRQQRRLLAVAVVDQLEQGLSAIYTFFDPNEQRRSLGTFAVLKQIAYTAEQGQPYLYLGYWIQNCRKMEYKIRYQPVELLVEGCWLEVDPRGSGISPYR
ncbi:arginyltransferase [Motiliproteus sediminis]|uniref:arginyltransferase n=1 Tax=Motiliproteus sediminis TaxID=1468178 RepID=UPI001AEFA30F